MENIKANELRIGNFYDHNGFVNEATPNTIEEVWIAERSWVKPIPLTEEWLLKFGFERTDQKDNSNDDWIWLFYQKDKIYIDGSDLTIETASGIVIKLEYVHQLQNLYFTLIGEELTFKSE